MRARHRHLLTALLAAVTIALSAAPSGAAADASHYCPAGTNWDNRIQRCA